MKSETIETKLVRAYWIMQDIVNETKPNSTQRKRACRAWSLIEQMIKEEGIEDFSRDKEPEPEYIYANDPIIKKRCVHVVVDGKAISLVTGNKFRYKGTRVKHYYRKSPLPRRRGHSRYTVRVKGYWRKGGAAR